MKRLIRFISPYRSLTYLVMGFLFLQVLSDLFLPTLMSTIVDTGVAKGDIPFILKTGAIMLLVAILGISCSITAGFFSSKIAGRFGKTMRERLFSHIEHFSLQEFDQMGTATLITRTTNDITQIQQVLMIMLRIMVMAPLMCIGGIIMAVFQDTKLSMVFIVIIPVLILIIFAVIRKATPLFQAIQKKVDQLNLVLREGLTGIRVIRAFNRVKKEQNRFESANNDLMQTSIKVNRIMGSMYPLMMLIMNLSSISIIWFGGLRIDAGHMQVGSLMAFLQYAMMIMFSLMMATMMFVFIPRATASAKRIDEVLQLTPVIHDPEEFQAPETKKGVIEFDQVTFHYPGAEKPAISNLTFTAEPGKVTAIIGGTGAGKTSLLNLIPRFYDPDKGEIRIDGIPIQNMTQEELRSYIGLVPQKSVLFTGTATDNIRYGKEDASEDEVKHAAIIAQAAEFIEEMPEKYNSMLSQGGSNLSGGQKQRLAIARALVRNALIYLFDDSFSALDFKTDAKLRAALRAETTNSTVFIVAQRVTTVLDADQIIVLNEGEISGIGTHHELMESCEVYREIVSSQLSEEEIA
ncbi:ATP-binding cassette, subfamily B [Seinonella peptonophila]|uniref:ATP-binding cassette, subfamily B n=1 Tax=Seinonella peptonophila TaxID=112248 RepID=A0A1M4TD61_9BACL|nr:ABC transporter ATP-binding protein [Seinonella peptonophila]SHE42489.1 ATP-binding cassette, subfamily B [Seinonella peptonophila]